LRHRLLLLLIFGTISSVLGVPRFAIMEDVTCSSCHSYQGGGGSRSSYGKEFVSESLVQKNLPLPWIKEDAEFPVLFGTDIRYQAISRDDLRHFPMQFDLYSSAEIGNLVAYGEISRILDDFRFTGGVRYEGLPLDSWLFAGKDLPVPGWRMDDHTTFIRGGNLTPLGLAYEGMPYTPYIATSEFAELGFMDPLGMEYTFSAGTPFIDETSDSTNLFWMTKLNQSLYLGSMTARYGIAYLVEGHISSLTASYGAGIDRFVYLGEYVEYHDWLGPDMISVASLNQVSYRLMRGLDLILRYEFFDPDRKFSTGAITRLGTGLEFFPVDGLEVKLSYQQHKLDIPVGSDRRKNQLLGQVHLYF